VIFGCAALYPYPEARTAEMAALTVSPDVQGQGDGERVLEARRAARPGSMGLDSIFVLTTRTMHWFIKRGFVQVDPDWLPEARKRKYNWDRQEPSAGQEAGLRASRHLAGRQRGRITESALAALRQTIRLPNTAKALKHTKDQLAIVPPRRSDPPAAVAPPRKIMGKRALRGRSRSCRKGRARRTPPRVGTTAASSGEPPHRHRHGEYDHERPTCDMQAFPAASARQRCANSYRNESISLHDAHGTRLQADHMLQIQTKHQHGHTGQCHHSERAAGRVVHPAENQIQNFVLVG